MITKFTWNTFFKETKLVNEESYFYNNFTPSQLAFIFTVYILATPFLIILDLILIPVEVIYYFVKRYYERKLENESN